MSTHLIQEGVAIKWSVEMWKKLIFFLFIVGKIIVHLSIVISKKCKGNLRMLFLDCDILLYYELRFLLISYSDYSFLEVSSAESTYHTSSPRT